MTGLPVDRNIPYGSRVSDRISTIEPATIHLGESVLVVTVLDLGLEGFGVLSQQPLDIGDEIYLDIPEEIGVERYFCAVSFCMKGPEGYNIGLKILHSEDDVVLIDEL
jgi:hypothetical protein